MERERGRGLKSSWEWLEFAAGLPSRHNAFNIGTGSGVVVSGALILTGGWISNSGAGAGHISLYDGLDNTGVEIWRQSVPATGSSNLSLPVKGVLCEIGLFAFASTSTLIGTLLYIPLWHYDFTMPGE